MIRMTTPQYSKIDTRKPDGFYIQFERVEEIDSDGDDKTMSRKRRKAFNDMEWSYIGIRARAKCVVVRSGVGTLFNMDSSGLWGVESDSGESYLAEVYEQEKAELLSMIEAMKNPVVEA
jgi:hypothetical protein